MAAERRILTPATAPALALRFKLGWMAARALLYRRRRDVIRDAPYGDHPRQRLDIMPAPRTAWPAPVFIFMHGGSFQHHSKDVHALVGRALRGAGITVVLLNYRLYPEVRYPAFVEDAAAGVRWVAANIERYGGNPNQIVVGGHSAGAYLSAMLALGVLSPVLPAGLIRGAVCMAGLYDLLHHNQLNSPLWHDIMGGYEHFSGEAQPVRHVSGIGHTPILLMHGKRDEVVPFANARLFHDELLHARADVTLVDYDLLDHNELLLCLADPSSDPTRRVGVFVRDATGQAKPSAAGLTSILPAWYDSVARD